MPPDDIDDLFDELMYRKLDISFDDQYFDCVLPIDAIFDNMPQELIFDKTNVTERDVESAIEDIENKDEPIKEVKDKAEDDPFTYEDKDGLTTLKNFWRDENGVYHMRSRKE